MIANDFSLGSKYVGEEKFRELVACVVQPGDLLVTMMGTSGRCQLVPSGIEVGVMDSHLLRLRVCDTKVEPRFAALLLDQAKYVDDQLQATGKGAIMHGLNSSLVKDIVLAIPPLPEQRAILAFLDRETAKIDALVKKKERLVELLQEKRTAIISQTVTKGLDPTVPIKDSGIEWLSKIPAHWEVKRVKWVSRLHRGYDLPDSQREDGEYPVVTSGGIVGFHLRFMAVGPGVVTGRYGSTGNVFYLEKDFWPHNTALYVCDFYGNLPRFVFCLLQTLSFEAYSGKSAVPGIDRNDLHEIRVAWPPYDGQLEIVEFIDREIAKIDALIAKVREGVEKLTEYRTALISAAVTGKIGTGKGR